MAAADAETITISAEALERLLGLRRAAPRPATQALLIEVAGATGNEWQCEVSLRPLEAAGSQDVLIDGELPIVVPGRDWEKLRGARVEWLDSPAGGGLRLRNPNRPSPVIEHAPVSGLSGSVAERVAHVLDAVVNPQIAAHGGRAQLVAVEDGTAYVRLGGGCQGCGMAGVTLDEGIELAIREAVPEVRRVVDVTDHASGTNPYYERAEV